MSCPNMIESIIAKSENNIVWLLNSQKPRTLQELFTTAHSIGAENITPIFPYFANKALEIQSLFADFYIRRLVRRNFVKASDLQLTPRGKTLSFIQPIENISSNETATMGMPFSAIPPNELALGIKSAKIKPLIDESALIMCALIPDKPEFFCVFSHYHPDAMRTAYPLMRDNDTFLALDTGDVRNILTFPTAKILEDSLRSLSEYMQLYCHQPQRFIEFIANLFLSISNIHFSHLCNGQFRTLNKLNDRIHILLDFIPSCPECNMERGAHLNLISLRHGLVRAWEKSILSEMFFSKLVTSAAQKVDPSIEVYPRLVVDGLEHECDTFVKRGSNVILFELKRSTTFDGWCAQGIKQLKENKAVLKKWGLQCKTALVTNIVSNRLPADPEIDLYMNPNDLNNIPSIVENLLS